MKTTLDVMKAALDALELLYQLEHKKLPDHVSFSDVYNKQLSAIALIKKAIAREKAQTPEPVAWAEFASNGNIKVWTQGNDACRELLKINGFVLTPLFTRPAPAQSGKAVP